MLFLTGRRGGPSSGAVSTRVGTTKTRAPSSSLSPQHTLQYSHYSPLSGLPDDPQNYHTVKIEIFGQGTLTHVSLLQDGNANLEERDHSAKNWAMILQELKGLVEQRHTS